MYAIIRTGGKQYKVQPGDVLRLEKLEADLGAEIQLTDILAIGGDTLVVGEPTVKNATVTLVVTNQRRGPKVIIFKKKRRQGYRRLTGHRQYYTEVFVKAISSPGGSATAETSAKVFNPEKKLERESRKAEYADRMWEQGRQEAKATGQAPKAAASKTKPTKAAKAATKPAKKAKGAKTATGAKKAAGTTKKAATTKKKASK